MVDLCLEGLMLHPVFLPFFFDFREVVFHLLLMIFLVVHVYMTTTGKTPTSNIKAMITGYEELEDDQEEVKVENDSKHN